MPLGQFFRRRMGIEPRAAGGVPPMIGGRGGEFLPPQPEARVSDPYAEMPKYLRFQAEHPRLTGFLDNLSDVFRGWGTGRVGDMSTGDAVQGGVLARLGRRQGRSTSQGN